MALSPTGTKSSTQRTNSQWPRWWASVSTCQKGDRNSSLRCRTSACSWPSRLGTSWWGESLSHTSPLPSPAPFEPQTLQERLERGIQLPICNHSDEKHEADTSWRAEVSSFAERITATTFWTPQSPCGQRNEDINNTPLDSNVTQSAAALAEHCDTSRQPG